MHTMIHEIETEDFDEEWNEELHLGWAIIR